MKFCRIIMKTLLIALDFIFYDDTYSGVNAIINM